VQLMKEIDELEGENDALRMRIKELTEVKA